MGGFNLEGPEGFGPNTVGAAQRGRYLPKSVNESEGLSLPELDAWETFKRSNPGTTDRSLDDWYRQNKLGADPNEGLDISEMADKLTALLKGRQP